MMETNNNSTGNWFVDKLTEYQSANTDNTSIKSNFLIRTHEFELIIDDLKNKDNDAPLQHELLLGRRGSGKSTLLKRLQIEIEENTELSSKYVSINLAEEQAGIYRLSDLWYEVLIELGNQTEERISLREFSSFKKNQDFTRYLYDEIHQILAKNNKKAILLLDNLDRILENFDDDANLFREILQNYNDIQIIGGSTRLDEHFWRYDKPFYEFFRRHRLESLTFEEIELLLKHWSKVMKINELGNYAKHNRGKIEALRILTDGLPRTLQFFIQILLQESNLYGFEYIKKVMDKATPLYQERLNSLTAPQRKIVLEMAFIWEASSTKQLVDKCRMEGKLISSFLKQLSNFGIVEVIPTKTKNHLYRISERFFAMWLIVTQGNPDQKRKAKFLTIFLETWYDDNEIKLLAENHLEKLNTLNIGYDKALVMSKALSQSKYISTQLRDALIDRTQALPDANSEVNELPVKYSTLNEKILLLSNKNKYDEAFTLIDEIDNEDDGEKFTLMGYILFFQNKLSESEIYTNKAIDKGKDNGLLIVVILLLTLNYFVKNKNAMNALKLIKSFSLLKKHFSPNHTEIIIEIWNGQFENIIPRIDNLFNKRGLKNLEWFLESLLYLEQKNLVLSYFESEKYGGELQERYALLYYATLILCNRSEENLELRIPPEVLPTVKEIVRVVKEKNAFYA